MAAAKKSGYESVGNGGNSSKPVLIGVSGGTASGKSTVCKEIVKFLEKNDTLLSYKRVAIVSQDSFYRPLSDEEQERAQKGDFNFDHPTAFDEQLMLKTLRTILQGQPVDIPAYDYIQNRNLLDKKTHIESVDVVLFEGILAFYFSEIRELFELKLFVDTDADTRLSRRVLRDTRENMRDLDKILHQYVLFVKPAFEEFCLPTKKYADVIIPRGAENNVAIDLIVRHIRELLKNNEQSRQLPVRVNSTPSDLLMYNDDDDYINGRRGANFRPH